MLHNPPAPAQLRFPRLTRGPCILNRPSRIVQGVSVTAVPETVVLRRPEEAVAALLDVPAEALLLRWTAHHLGAAGPAWERWLPLRDLGPDLADSTVLSCLLGRLSPGAGEAVNLQ